MPIGATAPVDFPFKHGMPRSNRSVRMKIIIRENSPQKLHLCLKPAMIATSVGGLVFLFCGTVTLWLLAGKTSVTANENGIAYQDCWLGLYTRQAWSLSTEEIQSIELFESTSASIDRSKSRFRRMMLTVGLPFRSPMEPQKNSSLENFAKPFFLVACRFVRSRAGSFRTLPWQLVSCRCIVCLCSIHAVDLVAVSSLGVFTIHRRNFYRRKLAELPIDQLRTLSISAWQLTTAKNHVVSYRVLLQQPNGRPISLTCLPSFDQTTAHELIQTIKEWLTLAKKHTRQSKL